MIKELCNEIIYNDFINKTKLTNDEIKILNNLLKKNSIVRISQELNMSDRTVSRIIKDIKEKYTNYKTIELAKINILKS